MIRILIAVILLCFSCNISFAKYCVKLPTCEELGYVFAAKNNRRQIRCPFDTDYALYLDYCQAYGLSTEPNGDAGEYQECIEEKKDGTKINTGYYRYTRCNSGYFYKSGECINIYYSYDIGDVYLHNGTPIGVIFDKDDETLEISMFALTNVDQDGKPNDDAPMKWSDKTTSTFLGSNSTYDGKKNTNQIINNAASAGIVPYVANAARSYAPEVCTTDSGCEVGKWYLPSQEEIKQLGQFKDNPPEEMELSFGAFWSSTEGTDLLNGTTIFFRFTIFDTNTSMGFVQSVNSGRIRPALKISLKK